MNNNRKLYIIILLLIFLNGCNSKQPNTAKTEILTNNIENITTIETSNMEIKRLIDEAKLDMDPLVAQYDDARKILNNIIKEYPNSSYVTDIKKLIKEVDQSQKEKISLLKQEVLNLIKLGKYEDVNKKIGLFLYNNKSIEDDEFTALGSYAYAKNQIQKMAEPKTNERILELVDYSLAEVSMEYKGLLSNEINALKLSLLPKEKWYDKYGEIIKREMESKYYEQKQKELSEKSEPLIGMTAEEVKNSKWGNPVRVNKTTTKYGTYEQWVYSNNKYIYFDNGKVTAIQQ